MRLFVLLPLLAVAAACSSDPTTTASVTATNASVEEVQKQVADAGGQMQMRPGQWEGTMTVKNLSPPGVGSGKPGESAVQPLKICVTPDQVKPGANPFIAQMQEGCKYDTFKLANGKIDATMTCARPEVTLKNKITGAFTADHYQLTSIAEATKESAGPLAGVRVESAIDARRIGDCSGDATKNNG